MVIFGTFDQLHTFRRPDGNPEKTEDGKELISPGGRGAPFAYISLTDVVDGTRISLQFVSLRRNQVIFQQQICIESKDRLKTIEIIAPLPTLNPYVSEAGKYAFEVVCDGEILGSARMDAIHHEIGEAPDESEDEES